MVKTAPLGSALGGEVTPPGSLSRHSKHHHPSAEGGAPLLAP